VPEENDGAFSSFKNAMSNQAAALGDAVGDGIANTAVKFNSMIESPLKN
jgi:hypothetical protein